MHVLSGLGTLVVRDYAWETEPQFTVCFVDLVRSHPREVSRLSAWGTACTPYPRHYSVAFAFSRVPYRLRRFPCLRVGDSGDLRLAPPQRAHPAYHVPRVCTQQVGVRMPLYTGRVHGCVGATVKTSRPAPPCPFWALGPLGGSTPRPRHECVTTEAAVPLSFPTILPTMQIPCATQPRIALPSA